MKIIITGGTGLIGRALAEHLAEDGHEVIILSRSPQQATGFPAGIRLEKWDGQTAQGWGKLADDVDAIVKPGGVPYTVFTPFSRAWQARSWPGEPLPAPTRIPTPPGTKSEGLPARPRLSDEVPFRAGESEAQRRLASFTGKAIFRYRDDRNRMNRGRCLPSFNMTLAVSSARITPHQSWIMLSRGRGFWAHIK